MEKKQLIEKLRASTSTVDVYNMKEEILRHLEGSEEKKKRSEE